MKDSSIFSLFFLQFHFCPFTSVFTAFYLENSEKRLAVHHLTLTLDACASVAALESLIAPLTRRISRIKLGIPLGIRIFYVLLLQIFLIKITLGRGRSRSAQDTPHSRIISSALGKNVSTKLSRRIAENFSLYVTKAR